MVSRSPACFWAAADISRRMGARFRTEVIRMTTQSEYPQPPLSLTKGLGPALAHDDPAQLIGSSLFAADRDFPQLTLNGPGIAHNVAAMMGYVRDRGVSIAPHGKTAMSPQLAQQQLDAGAWGITAATPFQLRVYRAAGMPRLLLANQLVEPGATCRSTHPGRIRR